MSAYHEPSTSVEDAFSKIESLDSYFRDCAEFGQGIATKETRWMIGAMSFVIVDRDNPFTAMREIMGVVSSPSSLHCLRVAMDEIHPNIARFFEPAEEVDHD